MFVVRVGGHLQRHEELGGHGGAGVDECGYGGWRASDVALAGACGPQDEGRGSVGGGEESFRARGGEAELGAFDEVGE